MRWLFAFLILSSCSQGFEPSAQNPSWGECSLIQDTTKISKASDDYFDSGAFSEITSCLPAIHPQGYLKLPIYAIELHDICDGDVISFVAEFEATNDFESANLMLASEVRLGSSLAYTDSIPVTSANGTNVSYQQHHWVEKKSGFFRAPQKIDHAYLVVWAWAADGASLEPTYFRIEPNYGRLTGTILSTKGNT